jgi:hypothetical protein
MGAREDLSVNNYREASTIIKLELLSEEPGATFLHTKAYLLGCKDAQCFPEETVVPGRTLI